jgi:hypothetical protein
MKDMHIAYQCRATFMRTPATGVMRSNNLQKMPMFSWRMLRRRIFWSAGIEASRVVVVTHWPIESGSPAALPPRHAASSLLLRRAHLGVNLVKTLMRTNEQQLVPGA